MDGKANGFLYSELRECRQATILFSLFGWQKKITIISLPRRCCWLRWPGRCYACSVRSCRSVFAFRRRPSSLPRPTTKENGVLLARVTDHQPLNIGAIAGTRRTRSNVKKTEKLIEKQINTRERLALLWRTWTGGDDGRNGRNNIMLYGCFGAKRKQRSAADDAGGAASGDRVITAPGGRWQRDRRSETPPRLSIRRGASGGGVRSEKIEQ